jgi:hypothetical protein
MRASSKACWITLICSWGGRSSIASMTFAAVMRRNYGDELRQASSAVKPTSKTSFNKLYLTQRLFLAELEIASHPKGLFVRRSPDALVFVSSLRPSRSLRRKLRLLSAIIFFFVRLFYRVFPGLARGGPRRCEAKSGPRGVAGCDSAGLVAGIQAAKLRLQRGSWPMILGSSWNRVSQRPRNACLKQLITTTTALIFVS